MTTPLRIGTRGSALALWQANHIAELLRPLAEPRAVELVEIQTQGDQVQDIALSEFGGLGVFTKAIQDALLTHQVDLAVHSLKDLPTLHVEGLGLAAVPERGPTGDALVSHRHANFDGLPEGATLATSSLRRRSQILHRRGDLNLIDIRGNVDTRLRKLKEQDLDGIILAEAGLVRLGLSEHITDVLDPTWMLPAVGQGALGLECRIDDDATRAIVGQLSDAATFAAVLAERALLRTLGGGCHVPIGARGVVNDDVLTLRGAVLSPEGKQRIHVEMRGTANEPEALGVQVAEELLAQGARAILASEA